MKIRTPYADFVSALLEYKDKFMEIVDSSIETEDQLNEFNEEFKAVKKSVSGYAKEHAPEGLSFSMAQDLNNENRPRIIHAKPLPFFQKVKTVKERAKERALLIENYLKYCEASDSLKQNRSLEQEREPWSVDMKCKFLMLKLYMLRKETGMWNVSSLFLWNDVSVDSIDEPREIADLLNGYIEKLGLAGGNVLTKINTRGKQYVENEIIPRLKEYDFDYSSGSQGENDSVDEKSFEEAFQMFKEELNDRFDDIDSQLEAILHEFIKASRESKAEETSYVKQKLRDLIFDSVLNKETILSLIQFLGQNQHLLGGGA